MMNTKKTLPSLFWNKVEQNPRRNAIGWIEGEEIKKYSNNEYKNAVEALSLGLIEIGCIKKDRVAILASTSKEWHLCDLAILCSSATVIPIYPTYLAEEVQFILNHSETTILIIEDSNQLEKFIKIQDKVKNIKTLISIKPIETSELKKLKIGIQFFQYSRVFDLGQVIKEKASNNFQQNIDLVEEDDIASIIYTSGTTGEPKGAVITQKAFYSMLKNITESLQNNIDHNDKTLTFLPLSHVFGRCDSMLNLALGLENVYGRSLDQIIDDLSIVKPTVMLAVPRIFEKVHAKIVDTIEKSSFTKKKVFSWAQSVSTNYFDQIEKDRSPSSKLIIERNIAYNLVYKKIYNRFGGNIRFFVSGGAPLSTDIMKFLKNANLLILEGYGLTETIAPCFVNPVRKQISGSVGLPLGDVKVKIARDGEILIKTEALFTSYYKNDDASKSVFTEDGWFQTGDIGVINSNGYLSITDRKKDIIITSGGKNVAPQKIENLLKSTKYISNAMVVGDQRKYLSVVLTIDTSSILLKLEDLGINSNSTTKELANNKQIIELLLSEIEPINKHLAKFETIKKIFIAPEDFSVENGMLTPSLKLKKKVIYEYYKNNIDAMY